MSSVAITTVPVYISLLSGLGVWVENGDDDTIGYIAALSFFPAGILYILARIFTSALAFTSLRDLPHGAFDTVHWTTFIPHV